MLRLLLLISLVLLLTLRAATAQDTLRLVYTKSGTGSTFAGRENFAYATQTKEGDHSVIHIQNGTARYKIHWKGMTKTLYRHEERITLFQDIFQAIGEGKYRYTISGVTYELKKTKRKWACYAGEEKILALEFYKQDKKQIVLVIAPDTTQLPAHVLVTTLYGVDELIRNKKTTFGTLLRTHMMMQLIK